MVIHHQFYINHSCLLWWYCGSYMIIDTIQCHARKILFINIIRKFNLWIHNRDKVLMQTITWTHFDTDLCHHVASLSRSEITGLYITGYTWGTTKLQYISDIDLTKHITSLLNMICAVFILNIWRSVTFWDVLYMFSWMGVAVPWQLNCTIHMC